MPTESDAADVFDVDAIFAEGFPEPSAEDGDAPSATDAPASSAPASPGSDATAGQAKAEAGTIDSPSDPEDVPKYSEREFQKRRAEQNSRADKATARADAAERRLAELDRHLREMRGQQEAMLLANQRLEELAQTQGITPFDITRVNRETYAAVRQRYDQDEQARQQREQFETVQRIEAEGRAKVATDARQAFFDRQVVALEREAVKEGVASLDVETALKDYLFSERSQRRVRAVNALTDAAEQAAAVSDLYEDAREHVRAKMQTLKAAAETTEARREAVRRPTHAPELTPQEMQKISLDEAFALAFPS